MAQSIRPAIENDHRRSDESGAVAGDSLAIGDVDDTLPEGGFLPPPPVPLPTDIEALAHDLFVAPTQAEFENFPSVAGYEILQILGRGGMGVVYLAKQRGLNRLVALKMLQSQLVADPRHAARFQTEAEAIARLQHPNIVQLFEVGDCDGRPYCALEYVPGGTLIDACREHLFAPNVAAELLATLAEAVHYAHEQGVLHRDLKPANILVTGCRSAANSKNQSESHFKTPTLKIADFGLAKWLDNQTTTGMTEHGLIVGTPNYMAPEQVAGNSSDITVTTDVYALGAILYELLTGRPPFKAASPLETARQAQFDDPTPPRRLHSGLSRDLETICLRCLEKSPSRRYPSAQELADELKRYCAGKPIQARPVGFPERTWKWARRRPAASALVVLTVAVVAASTTAGWIIAARERDHVRTVTGERDAADLARREKELYLQQTLETNERIRHLTDLFFSSTPAEKTSRTLLTEIAEVYRREVERDSGNPDMTVRRVRAKGMSRLAETLKNLGKTQEAYGWKRQSVALFRDLVKENPTDLELQLELGMSVNKLGQYIRLYETKSDETSAESIACHREAVALLAQLPPALDRLHDHSALGGALNNLGVALLARRNPNDLPEIRSLFEQAIQKQAQADRIKSTNISRQFLSIHYGGLAETFVRMGNHANAAGNIRQMLSIEPNNPRLKREAAKLLQKCAQLAAADPNLSPEQQQQIAKSYSEEAQQLSPATQSRDNKK